MTATVCLVACMRDEGPFILEWIAHHLGSGVTNFLIFSNDCTDGTDLILDRLDDMGIVRHLPNPSVLKLSTVALQRQAISYAHFHKEFRQSDWVLIIDADEFLNIRVGRGRIADLLDRVPECDAISMNQVVFGSGGIVRFEDAPVLEQFTRRFDLDVPMDRRHPLMFGIKTLARNDPDMFRQHRNHRPVPHKKLRENVRWVDGSGHEVSREFLFGLPRSYRTPEGTHDLSCVNHYAVRSLESYLVQSVRGDAIDPNIKRDLKYWRNYDRNDVEDRTILSSTDLSKPILSGLMEDPILVGLHAEAVKKHRQKIKACLDLDELSTMYREIVEGGAKQPAHKTG